ncbi:hypothetical protein SEA_FEDE_4 [Microbacterium phage Fede]|nr:hypothetical protein SEA_FEDE_4 [Microbacterium phage Fede]
MDNIQATLHELVEQIPFADAQQFKLIREKIEFTLTLIVKD